MGISKYQKKGLNIDLTYGQYQHLYNIMCSQEEIIDYLFFFSFSMSNEN